MTETQRRTSALADPPPSPWHLDRPEGPVIDPALGGELLVGPPGGAWGAPESPGTVVVAGDLLLAHAGRLDRLTAQLLGDAATLAALPPVPADLLAALPPGMPGTTGASVAQLAVREAAAAAERARDDLRLAVDRYAAAEAEQRARVVALGERLGAALGPVLRTLLVLGLPAVLIARAAGLLGTGTLGPGLRAAREWLLANPRLITDPVFVEAVRATAMGADDAAATAAGLPPDVLERLGAPGGFDGVETGAALVLGGAGLAGLFRETPVTVERTSTMVAARGPQGAEERLARVPEGDQVRIERYEAPGLPDRYVVYVGPTETFSPVAAREPWDLTSNVTAVAGLSAGSERATIAAMRDAGIGPEHEVQFVGFSQGGLVATRLAASGDWHAAGLETYGAPAGGIALPPGLAGMAVRHTDDFIPALGGPQRDHQLLQLERRAFEPGSPIPTELPAPAHQRSAYVATATAIDDARSDAVRDQVAAMDAFTSGYTERDGSRVTVMTYRGERGAARAVSSGGSIP